MFGSSNRTQQRNDLSVSDLVDLKQLSLDGKYVFVTKGYADDFFIAMKVARFGVTTVWS